MGLVPDVILALNFLIDGQWQGLFSYVLFIGFAVMSILIGLKLWVEAERKKGLWTLLKQAFQQDKEEAGNLAKSFLKPSGAKTIIKILGQIALIDEVLEPREKEFVQTFANNWNINFDWDELTSNRAGSNKVNYVKLRQDFSDYLATSPPDKQVSQLKDVITALINVDEEVSEQEQLILGELNGLFSRYLDQHDNLEVYHVVVAPQSDRQEEVIANSFPELSRYSVGEGHAYNNGPFYSKQYAQIICEQYRSLNLFSIVAASLPA
ncbi:hypothetical protein [Okeania sp. KiyG1]|uniref:hypothetical protein n=1 Tax=Okeania sp. KiyG1 TaxID=2720165 RepID=UPI001921F172|nr:hypothetical protein [Okeania sp. KiyG1]